MHVGGFDGRVALRLHRFSSPLGLNSNRDISQSKNVSSLAVFFIVHELSPAFKWKNLDWRKKPLLLFAILYITSGRRKKEKKPIVIISVILCLGLQWADPCAKTIVILFVVRWVGFPNTQFWSWSPQYSVKGSWLGQKTPLSHSSRIADMTLNNYEI